MNTKLCKWCDPPQEKPVTEFYVNRRAKDGLSNKCKACESKAHKQYYRHRRTHRASNYRINYKITVKDFNRMFREQEGQCAICRTPNTKLVVDHDHETGMVRGLLCTSCNHMLGRVKDSVSTLQNAINYLERANEQDRQTVS